MKMRRKSFLGYPDTATTNICLTKIRVYRASKFNFVLAVSIEILNINQ